MKKEFKVVRIADADLSYDGGGATGSTLVRSIDETMSDEMGGGYFSVGGIENHVPSLPYDEICICIKGTLKLTVDGVLNELAVGDFAFIPTGTAVTFGGDDAVAFYGVHPVDWRARAAG